MQDRFASMTTDFSLFPLPHVLLSPYASVSCCTTDGSAKVVVSPSSPISSSEGEKLSRRGERAPRFPCPSPRTAVPPPPPPRRTHARPARSPPPKCRCSARDVEHIVDPGELARVQAKSLFQDCPRRRPLGLASESGTTARYRLVSLVSAVRSTTASLNLSLT